MDSEEMKQVISGMIDRDTVIRWTLEAKDRQNEEALARITMLEQTLEDIKAIAIQAMTEPSPMPNALTWDCFNRIRNAVDRARSS